MDRLRIKNSDRGFTLIELLIVVVILGILAAIAIPQFTSSTEDAVVTSLQSNLAVLRQATEYYKAQHRGSYPGYPVGGGVPTSALFTNHVTLVSKSNGSTAAMGTPAYPFGPYIKVELPVNPVNSLNTIQVLANGAAFPVAADDSTGWIFKPQTGQLKANATGDSPSGVPYYDL